uniref:C-type lectin domain-containing protein n=1 Tax=Myripristis murdjan TaxID=586833 RepID=A0A668A4W8_9TELE
MCFFQFCFIVLLYCMIFFMSLYVSEKTCPAGWRMFSCVCYFVSTESKPWEQARLDCRDRGADLVIIDSPEEQTFISSHKTSVWIGLNDRDNEGTWKWTDGTPMTKSYWNANQPDNWGEEDCVHINNFEAVNNWNDLSCGSSLRWICEEMA